MRLAKRNGRTAGQTDRGTCLFPVSGLVRRRGIGVFPFAHAASRAAVHSGMAKAQTVIPMMIGQAVGIADGYKWSKNFKQGYNRKTAGNEETTRHTENNLGLPRLPLPTKIAR